MCLVTPVYLAVIVLSICIFDDKNNTGKNNYVEKKGSDIL